jgi:Mg/Co/Ni transporter MgtE
MIDDIQKIIDCVDATLAIERLEISKKAKVIRRKYLVGEITSQEAIDAIKEIYMDVEE